jgi:putative transposase
MIYVLSQKKKPLMPCSNVIARLLLKQGKAKIKHRTPFTIQLTYVTETEYVQVLTHGVDSGSSKIGSAVVDENGKVLYQAEVEMEVDKNHLHCLVKSEPRISPLAIVRKLKQESTHRIWLAYEKELKRHFWRERTFWSDGYFVCSIGNVSKDTIQRYIQQQG